MIRSNMSRQEIEDEGFSGITASDVSKIINDFYLITDREEQSVGRWLSDTGFWESWITSWMTKNISPGFTCVDVGANYGYYTRIMERLSGPDGYVYAIEANPELSELIKRSINDYPIDNASAVEVFTIAASDSKGSDILNIPEKFIGGSSLVYGKEDLPSSIADIEWNKRIEVNTDSLDNILSDVEHIDIIKMDIEGAEPLAWGGMSNVLEKTDILVVECGSYSPTYFIDEFYNSYHVSMINNSGDEEALPRKEFNKLTDLAMIVLRKS